MERIERGKLLNEQVEQYVAELEAELTQGHSQAFMELLQFYSKHFHSYSIANTWLILYQCPTASRCAGFRQWEKLGCTVRKGEKAIWVRAPRLKKLPNLETGELEEKLIGYLAVPVFDLSQVDGADNLPSLRHPLEGNYGELYDELTRLMINRGFEVYEKAIPGGTYGVSYGGRIVIHDNQPVSDKCLTLFHEAAHEVIHKGPEREKMTTKQRELEAEATSYLLARIFGLESPFSRDYILRWKGTVEHLHTSLGRIHQAVKTIYGWIEAEEPVAIAAD